MKKRLISKKSLKKGGEKVMKKLLTLVLLFSMAGMAQAVTTDSVTLVVTPVFNLSVNIVNGTTNYETMSMGSSKTLNVGKIWNDGNVSSNWEKQATNSSDGWVLDEDGSPGQDRFSLLAIATGTAWTPRFESGSSADSILALGTSQTYCYVPATFDDLTDGDANAAASIAYVAGMTADLWISLLMPTDITISGEQTITLSVRATTP